MSECLLPPLCCPGGLDLRGPSRTKRGVPSTGQVGRLRPEPWLQGPGMTLARTSSNLKWVSRVVGPQRKAKHGRRLLFVAAVFCQVPVDPVSKYWTITAPRETRGRLLPAVVTTFSSTNRYTALLTCACTHTPSLVRVVHSLPLNSRQGLPLGTADGTMLGPFSTAKSATESVKSRLRTA